MGFLDEIGERTGTPPGRPRRTWLVLGMLLLLAVAGYVALHQLAAGRVPLGTTVAGVPVGGLERAEAAQRLTDRLGPRLHDRVTLLHQDREYHLVPAAAGMRLDLAGTLDAAAAGAAGWSPGSLWRYLTGGREVAGQVTTDDQRFTDALDALTRRIGRPAIEGGVAFVDGHARPVYGRTGLAVDHSRTQTLVARLAFTGHAGELPVAVRHPYVSRDAVRRALRTFARPAMSGPVLLVLGGRRVVAPPRLVGKALSMVPERGRLVPLVDGDRLVTALAPVMRTLGPKPVDATVRIRGGRPVVVPAVDGISFDRDTLAARLPRVLVRAAGHRVLRLHAVVVRAGRSTEQVRRMHITDRLASVAVAADGGRAHRLDEVLVPALGSLDLADRLGRPDRVLGTALFTAALRGGLPITAWTPTGSYDAALPAGLQMTDVTVQAPAGAGLLVTVDGAGGGERLTLWSTPPPRVRVRVGPQRAAVPAGQRTSDATGCRPRAGVPGFTVVVHRRVRQQPVETFTSRYRPVPARLCGPSASPSASPPASPSSSSSGPSR